MYSFLKKTFGVLVVFVLLVIVLEVIYRLVKIPKIVHHSIRNKGQKLIPKINSNTILIIGDSRLEWGIKPLVVLEQCRAAGINCNVINMSMPGSNGLDVLHYLIQHDIHPKLVIHGYAPNYGEHENHGFDKAEYSEYNKITEDFSYWLDQNFYFRDQSVLNHIKRMKPYFKSNQYDSLGGAVVTEYGDYTYRSSIQFDIFKGVNRSFKQTELDKYFIDANAAVETLKNKGAVVCGLYMPVSKKIYDLQNLIGGDVPPINYNKFYNYGSFTYTNELPFHDSTYFYDDCHLTQEYAKLFTGKVIDSLQKDFTAIK